MSKTTPSNQDQIDLKPVPTVRFRSGLEMLRSRGSRGSRGSSAVPRGSSRFTADELTWIKWRGVDRIRACDALALHFHLDPDDLGLGPHLSLGANGQCGFGTLYELYGSGTCMDFNNEFDFFGVRLAQLPFYIRCGSLQCAEMGEPLEWSVTTVEEFSRFVGATCDVPAAWFGEVAASPEPMATTYTTPLLETVNAAREMWRTVAEGGTYIPGDRTTEPDTYGFFAAKGLPPYLCKAAVTFLRDPLLGPGRRPSKKRGGKIA